MFVGDGKSVAAFAEDSASGASIMAEDSALTLFSHLADFSTLEMIFTLANFSALVALGHLLAT